MNELIECTYVQGGISREGFVDPNVFSPIEEDKDPANRRRREEGESRDEILGEYLEGEQKEVRGGRSDRVLVPSCKTAQDPGKGESGQGQEIEGGGCGENHVEEGDKSANTQNHDESHQLELDYAEGSHNARAAARRTRRRRNSHAY
ncbi:zinc ion binding [Striga asiatica]|uniref:Zinc ion binding n=1 Tax=Striga asiatica TaxID=4170 RepID=A0A5A7NYL7_STRAF|nr:zinc ion binding [Striga asiatica]